MRNTETIKQSKQTDHINKNNRQNLRDIYLKSGSKARFFELGFSFRALMELIRGYRAFHYVGPCVSVFGSARFTEDHQYYKMAMAMGSRLPEMGFTVMTGGGPGVMEAANRGSKEAGGRSVGCNIDLQMEPGANKYLDKVVTFKYFFIRKVMLFKYSYAFVIMPGGFGTMDELFEAITLLQTRKIKPMPVILMGKDYWQPLLEMINHLREEKTIDPEDLDLLTITDDVDEAIAHIQKHAVEKYNLKKHKRSKPFWHFGESKE